MNEPTATRKTKQPPAEVGGFFMASLTRRANGAEPGRDEGRDVSLPVSLPLHQLVGVVWTVAARASIAALMWTGREPQDATSPARSAGRGVGRTGAAGAFFDPVTGFRSG